jgi:hypothetical protein
MSAAGHGLPADASSRHQGAVGAVSKTRRVAGIVYAALTVVVVAFQLALAFGAPWGAYALGGAYPGRLPPVLRVAACFQAAVLVFFAAAVLARAGLAFSGLARASRWLVWLVVVFAAVSSVLNLATPSAGERMLWAPVALVLLASSLLVATGRARRDSAV